MFIIICIEKTKINKNRPGMAHFKNIYVIKTFNVCAGDILVCVFC